VEHSSRVRFGAWIAFDAAASTRTVSARKEENSTPRLPRSCRAVESRRAGISKRMADNEHHHAEARSDTRERVLLRRHPARTATSGQPSPARATLTLRRDQPAHRRVVSRSSETRFDKRVSGSGRRDLNSGPLVPQTSALTRLRHAPRGGNRSNDAGFARPSNGSRRDISRSGR
jgi:hypothetical protein